ncbi:MAG: helix-turn-helix domain-containing protein [Ignavibacteriales bacterium]|nr:helix-turn-helix domain-containing protein [Ignavibacteriales bacterium]
MRINLSSTPHYVCRGDDEILLDDVYFLGLQDQYTNTQLKLNGDVDVMGICFKPYGFFPFLKIPVAEVKNQILGADEVGFKIAKRMSERLKGDSNIANKLAILEDELLSLLDNSNQYLDKFQEVFNSLKKEKTSDIRDFCKHNGLNIRQLERFYSKYIGLPPNTYATLNRFHCSLSQLLSTKYLKLSDLAYDNEYFDQMHFIKDFKRYTGSTPKKFINQENSILQIGKLT